jgi:hypothetical protein
MKTLAALIGLLFITATASAQHATAPNGYYPDGFSGDTWTGVVSNVNETTGEFTLTYTKGNKTETFVGVPEEGYLVAPKDGPVRPLKLSDIHVGRTVTVFYMPVTKKVDGKKVTVNTVFNINSIPNNKVGKKQFRAFS